MYFFIIYLLIGVIFVYVFIERLVIIFRDEELLLGSFILIVEKIFVYI